MAGSDNAVAASLVRRAIAASRGDRAGGTTLAIATVAALVWANVAPGGYFHLWQIVLSIEQPVGLTFSVRDWINQGLMTGFFMIVGLEIRREISSGELTSIRRAAIPVTAALGGMVVPAVVYSLIVHGSTGSGGWGVPMATDVAFSLGALALVAPRSSRRLRVFLMTLAVADDIVSIILLMLFSSAELRVGPLLVGVGGLVAIVGVELVRPAWIGPQLLLGGLAWWGFARGGVEAAVVGVAIGAMALPSPAGRTWARLRGPRGWEQRIEPWVTLLVLPVFALANAGVSLRRFSFSPTGTISVFVAVLVARVVGKPIGIALGRWVAGRRGGGLYDPGIPFREIVGVGSVASVGFTVPLLIIRAALPEGPLSDSATLGLLAGTVCGALSGGAILTAGRSRRSSGDTAGQKAPNGANG